MQKTTRTCDRKNVSCIFPALLWFIYLVAVTGQNAAAGPFNAQSCPLVSGIYKAQPVLEHLQGTVGDPLIFSFTLSPKEPPPGFFLSVNPRMLEKPSEPKMRSPEVLPGFPDTRIQFFHPGTYRYAVVISLIAKSSCGGVKADTIYNGELHFSIAKAKHP